MRFLAGMHLLKNLYITHCEERVDASLRAFDSAVVARIKAELCAVCGTPTLRPVFICIDISFDRISSNLTPYSARLEAGVGDCFMVTQPCVSSPLRSRYVALRFPVTQPCVSCCQ